MNYLQEINESYNYLIPPYEEASIIFILNKRIKNKEIDQNFTYQDFKEAIKESLIYTPGKSPQTERILKNLLHSFLECPAEKKNRYKLTEYALKFISLVDHKLNNPLRKFPLRESFKKYTDFHSEEINNINQLESWHEQGFNNTTKQNIVEHLEALKDEVHSSIEELNQILYKDQSTVIEMVNKFSAIFKQFGERADEIKDTLRLGNNLIQEFEKVINFFYSRIEKKRHPETEEERKEYTELDTEYEKAVEIQNSIENFFLIVDEKLGQLREKILFASNKLTELHENFKYQTKFKTNLRRLLELILTEGRYSKKGPRLPKKFPLKIFPYEEFRFIEIPYHSFLIPINKVLLPIIDSTYEKQEREKITRELKRQVNTVIWVKKCKQLLKEEKRIDFTKHFYEILEVENDVEIPLRVGFELLQFANQSKEYSIGIKRHLLKEFEEKKNIDMANEDFQPKDFSFLEKRDVQEHFANLNITLLRGGHIQRDNYYLFQLLSEYNEELKNYYAILYGLILIKDKVDSEEYFYLSFPSEGKGKISHPSRHKELSETETIIGIILLNIYYAKYFEHPKEVHWNDLRKEILEGENSIAYKKLLFKDIREDYSDREWEIVKKYFRNAFRDFDTLGWIKRLAEEENEIHFNIKESIHRFAKLYDREINHFEEFVESYRLNKTTNEIS